MITNMLTWVGVDSLVFNATKKFLLAVIHKSCFKKLALSEILLEQIACIFKDKARDIEYYIISTILLAIS